MLLVAAENGFADPIGLLSCYREGQTIAELASALAYAADERATAG